MTQTQSSNNSPSEEVIAQLHAQYLADKNSVPLEWQSYFQQMESLGLLPGAAASACSELTDNNEITKHSKESRPAGLDAQHSDRPPLPRSVVHPPTSPYAAMVAKQHYDAAKSVVKGEDHSERLKGISAAIAKNMDASLSVPAATSYRQIPAKVLIENRAQINDHLKRTRGGKVSFTHLIGYAIVEALVETPDVNVRYRLEDGKPCLLYTSDAADE